ncbi:MAG: hypothetical protein RBT45_05065 [Acholeplasmataceae bacterium]|jgi:hypothetical protein|nr:hypothetical protein [Acholeplasmataceae bacterium]
MKKIEIIQTINLLIKHFEKDPHVLCFLGLGSLANQERLDDYSDLDFFLIVEEGYKPTYLESLFWLDVKKIVYQFRNTNDGYKVLYEDGVFLEFAVFEESELKSAEFSPGRILYMKEGFDPSLVDKSLKERKYTDPLYRVGEILTNLYIGLLRDKRGEKASAFSFIQVYAMHHIYHLLPELFKSENVEVDQYVAERRIEFRVKQSDQLINKMIQGYDKNKESAYAILQFISSHYEVNQDLKKRILDLIQEKK